PQGGTHDFLAPEYLRGAPTSVGGDLYALGACLRRAAGPQGCRAWEPRLQDFVNACLSEEPLERPASAEAALAALGSSVRPFDRFGELPRIGSADALHVCERALLSRRGETLVVRAARGSGRRRFVRDLGRFAVRNGIALAQA